MQKKYYYLLISLLCATYFSVAQNIEKNKDANSQYIFSNMFSPSIFYGSNPRVTLGYLFQLEERWIYGIELGYSNYNFLGKDFRQRKGIDQAYKLFEIRPSINYILNPNAGVKPYFAIELFYINHKDVFINNTEVLYNDRYINNGYNEPALAYDKADFSRQKYGVNFNFGFLLEIFKRFGVNCNLGLGLRNRNITYTNIINATEIGEPDPKTFVRPIHLLETGNKLGLNLNADLKLFYRIR